MNQLNKIPKLALGTVQFGLTYGVAGRGEPVPENEVREILEDAAARGIDTLDTAPAYGNIEERLAQLSAGLPFRILSKIRAIPAEMRPHEAASFALQSASQSLERLGPALTGIFLHKATDWAGDRGKAIADRLITWAVEKGIRIGLSCYSPDELLGLAKERPIALAQLPGNAFDQRLKAVPAENLTGIEIHIRSAFLQGLLLMPSTQAAHRIPAAREALVGWENYYRRKNLTPLESALSIVKSFTGVNNIVVGVDNLRHWKEISTTWTKVTACSAEGFACNNLDIIDPRKWPQLT